MNGQTLAFSMQHRFPGGVRLDIGFTAPLPGVVALFGPSGSGKSSLVHGVAGLLRPDRSAMRIGAAILSDERVWLRPEQRRVGMVFQDARLFPHLDVAANLRYGARRATEAAEQGAPGFDELVALLGLDALLARKPGSLSGGEAQRVAIGRALLSRPRLLALDEPLAGLDDQRRSEILPYLARLRQRLQLPILYVTHALDEVIRLADTLVLLRAGQVLASGPVAALLGDAHGPLALRDDAACVLDGRLVASEPESGLLQIAAGGFLLRVPAFAAASSFATPARSHVRVKIPAREVMLATADPAQALPRLSVQNILPAIVSALAADPARRLVTVSLRPRSCDDGGSGGGGSGGGGIILAQVTADSARRLALAPDLAVLALVKSVSVEIMTP